MRRRQIAGSRWAALAAMLPVILLGVGAGPAVGVASAQVHHLAEAPWQALAGDSWRRSVEMSWQQALEPDSGWRVDRLGLTILMPMGQRSLAFVRADYLRFDTGDRPVFSRWPQLLPEEGDPDWPYETIINNFGRPEFGVLLPLTLPLAGPGDLGFQVGLPIGTDRLYPQSAACIPLRADWRRIVATTRSLQVAVRLGFESTFSTIGDDLAPAAYPDGWRWAFVAGSVQERPRGWQLAWTARELQDARNDRNLNLSGWLPLPDGHRLVLQVARAIGDRDDRSATWVYGLTWRVALPMRDEDPGVGPGRQNATDDDWPDGP
jgi:hypothetical protein